jgi:hypothetical protein
MSRLYFAPLEEAFYLRSDNIKDTKTEIDNLKKLIMDSTISKKPQNNQISKIQENPNKVDQRIGYSDQINANFRKGDPDMDLLKIMQHPKFEDIVKSYLIVKYPELVNQQLNNTTYNGNFKQNTSTFGQGYSAFGQGYSTTFCSNIKNYTIFFIFSIIIYLFLEKVLKK